MMLHSILRYKLRDIRKGSPITAMFLVLFQHCLMLFLFGKRQHDQFVDNNVIKRLGSLCHSK